MSGQIDDTRLECAAENLVPSVERGTECF